MYVWSGSAWVSVASEVESLAGYATQSYADNQPGMKLIVPSSVAVGSGSGSVATQGTVTFSGASSVSLNNVFSSTYKNYKLVANVTQSSSGVLQIRWRTAGSDNTAATYYDYFAKPGTNSATYASNYNNGGTSSYFTDNTSGTDSLKAFSLDIFSPNETQRTYYSGNSVSSANSAGQPYYGGFVFGGFNNTTVFDSMTLFPVSGTITGTISIYGYKAG
jgi:hypothetical protein